MTLAWQCLAGIALGFFIGLCTGIAFASRMASKDLAALAKVIRTL